MLEKHWKKMTLENDIHDKVQKLNIYDTTWRKLRELVLTFPFAIVKIANINFCQVYDT